MPGAAGLERRRSRSLGKAIAGWKPRGGASKSGRFVPADHGELGATRLARTPERGSAGFVGAQGFGKIHRQIFIVGSFTRADDDNREALNRLRFPGMPLSKVCNFSIQTGR